MAAEHTSIEIYHQLFVNRPDVYAVQNSDGSYYSKQSPVTDRVLTNHLLGKRTIGLYALSKESQVKWAVLDADKPNGLDQLQQAWKELVRRSLPTYLELSRRGGHLWMLFSEPIEAGVARQLLLGAVPGVKELELYPKQNRLDRSTPLGSLVRAPLGIHQLTGERYPFVNPETRSPVARTARGMIEFLDHSPKVTLAMVTASLAQLLTENGAESPTTLQPLSLNGARLPKAPVSAIEKAKQRIGDPYSFITSLVQVDQLGRVHCPFHPPDNHPSMRVNPEGRWTCFHETNSSGHYLGGDTIDFYMRLKGLSYKEALKDIIRKR
jgi:hypothetical protein